jgi:hypothetical protein
MEKFLRYRGEFLSRAGVKWRVDILQDAEKAFEAVGDLTFEADEAVIIQWDEKPKNDVICGSTATIRLESPGDRTYEDLYTIEPGSIRADIYRNDVIYWSGALDPEFYEEPYEKAANYTVSLTFSDFGILGRKKYTADGMKTMADILSMCLSSTGINYKTVDASGISTQLESEGGALSLDDITVLSDNFYDEDGEASTLQEVLEGVFQPLALRIIQKAGVIYIYDLNGLYAKDTKEIQWDGDSSTMGVDSVYNNAKVTWSTYARSGNLLPDTCWTEKTKAALSCVNNLLGVAYGENCRYFSYHYDTDIETWSDRTDSGFTLWTSVKGENLELINGNARFYKIIPQYDGTESEGVAVFYRSVQGAKVGRDSSLKFYGYGNDPIEINARTVHDDYLFKTKEAWLPPVDDPSGLLLKVVLPMLVDPRFNPFETAVDLADNHKEKSMQDKWNARGNFMYIPVLIKYQPDGSDKVYCWDNRSVVFQDPSSTKVKALAETYGSWVEYTATDRPQTFGYLAYYDADDRKEKSGVANGFADNRSAINPHTDGLTTMLAQADSGQYIPYPTMGPGKIWIQVLDYNGWLIVRGGTKMSRLGADLNNTLYEDAKYDFRNYINWILFQMPTLEILNGTQFDMDIDTDDVEYEAELNADAKESIDIDTICGTAEGGVPTARGAYFNTTTRAQITELTRAGRTSQAEELLIGTLYSQFADRRTKLNGEMVLDPDGLTPYTEQNQGDKKFIMVGESQDLIADTTDGTIIELRPDEYEKEE